ncbi:MAG TPA: ComEA family DNA-binding protein [Candidatus Udaeobacter sp.]|nr:ComEA family DNA-binding protein [Candidatus Udaeobacter sp.]
MKSSSYRISNKQLLLAAILIMAAVIFLAAALMEPKQTAAGEWVPLNDAVETALASLTKPNEKGGADEPFNKQSTAKAINQTVQQASPIPEADESTGPEKPALEKQEAEAIAKGKAQAEAETETKAESEADAEANEEGRLDINRATAAELDTLKGIGPSKAQAIVQDRDKNGKYASVEDLLRVKGIGEKLLFGLRDSIVARP